MEFLERVLDEKATELARLLTDEAGFTAAEAERFLSEAGPALIESYEWQTSAPSAIELDDESAVRDLLAGIWGRTLARRLGFSEGKTWAGLRSFVPAVVDASTERRPRSGGGGDGHFARATEASFIEIGYALRLEPPTPHPRSMFGPRRSR